MNIDNLPPEIGEALADIQVLLQRIDIFQLYDPIPAGHLVFNAPRPLAGHVHTQGDPRYGIFYSFIDPSQPDALQLIQDVKDYKGWLIVLGTATEMDEIAVASFYAKSSKYAALYERVLEDDLQDGTKRAERIRFDTLQRMKGSLLGSIIQLRTAP